MRVVIRIRQLIGLCVLGIQVVRFPLRPHGITRLSGWYIANVVCLFEADAEALQVTFDPSIVTYRQLLEFFYRMHDPTTQDRQGPDVGTQYRSAIFTHDEEQSKIAHEITDKVAKEWYKQPVTTQIVPAGQWWDAEEYHQLYLHNNPSGYECPSQYVHSFPCDGAGVFFFCGIRANFLL